MGAQAAGLQGFKMQASGLRSQKSYSYVTLTKCHSGRIPNSLIHLFYL